MHWYAGALPDMVQVVCGLVCNSYLELSPPRQDADSGEGPERVMPISGAVYFRAHHIN